MRQFSKRVISFVVLLSLLVASTALPVFPFTPRAEALNDPCALDPNNLIVNGSMAVASPDYGVAANWNKFVLSGAPTFEHVDNEQIDPNGSQYIWEDTYAFDAGVYQTVTGLTPGIYYHFWLGYALAAYDPGTGQNLRNDLIGRQVGIDLTGGTDPSAATVMWGSVYWDGNAALNIPALSMTFAAPSSRATIFLRAVNNNIDNGRSKVWFDSVCMEPLDPQPAPPVPSTLFLPFISVASIACTPLTTIAAIPVGTHPKGIAADPATNRVFVSLFDSSQVAVINAATNQHVATWSTNSTGHSNGIAVGSGKVFVALRDAASLAALDASTGAFVANSPVESEPYGVGVTSSRVWVANFSSNSVSVLDAASTNVIATTNVGASPSLVAPATTSAFVSYLGGGVVELADDGTVLHDFTTTGAGSFGVAFDAAANLLYVSNRDTSQIIALDAATGAIIKSVTLAHAPYALAFNPTSNHLFAALVDSNQLQVLDGATLANITSLSVGSQGAQGGDGVAALNGRVYVANNDAGTVSVIQDACP